MTTFKNYFGQTVTLNNERMIAHAESPANNVEAILDGIPRYKEVLDQIVGTLQEKAVCIDIGANVGLFTLYVEPVFDTVILCEPCSSHYNTLVENMDELNKIEKMDLNRMAVGAEDDWGLFYFHETNSTMNSLVPITGHSGEPEKVWVCSLKSLIEPLEHVDLIKIDAEGGELNILMSDTFGQAEADKIHYIWVEVHVFNGHTYDENRDMMGLKLRSLGFKVTYSGIDGLFAEKE